MARTISQVGDVAQFTTLALLIVALNGSGAGVWQIDHRRVFVRCTGA
ncbi:MAG: hypothetical protein KY440_10170 [Actinobacteria bacterium]|nr:hypothetical protein [Actinomycetota bacterium]